MLSTLESYLKKLPNGKAEITSERISLLDEMATYIAQKKRAESPVKLVFICTHNSRRSHMSQIWAATLAYYFGVDGIETYSGGTEVTAMNIRVVNALHKAGFAVINPGGSNPHYAVNFDREAATLMCYSKTYDAPENPDKDFAAIMTCDHADETCPFIPGADKRFSLYYSDPKEADDTPWEADRYEERLYQIGAEMYYLMEKVKLELND
ncbi:MAG: protein-tyrosine-phosphatase [Cyclobacteriaceae bacterium]